MRLRGTGYGACPELVCLRIGRVWQWVSMSLFPGLPREWEGRIEGLGLGGGVVRLSGDPTRRRQKVLGSMSIVR